MASPVSSPSQRQCEHSGNNKGCDTIPLADFLRVLKGVQAATSAADACIEEISEWASSKNPRISFDSYRHALDDDLKEASSVSRRLAKLTLAVCFLRQKGQQAVTVTPTELGCAWNLIHEALTSDAHEYPLCKTSRSAQGFLSVALCSIVTDGLIDEMFRLHVWEPDGSRGGDPRFAIHAHQVFAQSWILAGEGTEHSYEGGPVEDELKATHTAYSLSWSDGEKSDNSYKLNQVSSTIRNTGKLMRYGVRLSATHRTGESYSIEAGECHIVEVPPQEAHATLFFFDASRGFLKDAPVLGPKDSKSYTQTRDPAGATPALLAGRVEATRQWEAHMSLGRQFSERAEWEHALQSLNSALHMCEVEADFLSTAHYRSLVLGKIGSTNRRFGRYEMAKKALERAVAESATAKLRLEFSGELGVVYRHMDLIHNARDAFEMQYQLAKQIGEEEQMCRAIGNLGMVNYQIWLSDQEASHLQLAIQQLTERVETAQRLRARQLDNDKGGEWNASLRNWEIIGLARLSLCLAADGKTSEAVIKASESLRIAKTLKEPTVVAMSRFYYGRALLHDGRDEEASEVFNALDSCTPAIAFCKEPSEEHRGYLGELINAGANLDLVDEHGYCALDYAVFNEDKATQTVIVNSLGERLDSTEIANRLTAARLRKAYREIFQEQLRPLLLGVDEHSLPAALQIRYSDLVAADPEKRSLLDELKYIPYSRFLAFGRIPRSNEAPVERLQTNANDRSNDKFLIFFSYRWIGSLELGQQQIETLPDDSKNTQYQRMLCAIDQFLLLYPNIDRESLGIWVDYACVDQDNPTRGVNTLPLVITQCNAIISLFEEDYYERAWCCVEALLVQVLKRSYGYHMWYETVPSKAKHDTRFEAKSDRKEGLREASIHRTIAPTSAKLTIEADRPIIMFLERQARLLGNQT
ncbi:hypothetical protein HD806DRAFT_531874 [Xylariaceae sp. AK1471]|nr:hypothetical protein HD806DRAFT_531874 [Xylariaceae sp. AK1471]